MKVWSAYGSEHSMNLVMIGHFTEAHDAKKAKELIDRLSEQVRKEPDAYRSDSAPEGRRFSDAMMEFMRKAEIYILGSSELEQFNYDVKVNLEGRDVVITTEEADVSAFLKILIDKGARVEVYSAHDHPDTGHGRGC